MAVVLFFLYVSFTLLSNQQQKYLASQQLAQGFTTLVQMLHQEDGPIAANQITQELLNEAALRSGVRIYLILPDTA